MQKTATMTTMTTKMATMLVVMTLLTMMRRMLVVMMATTTTTTMTVPMLKAGHEEKKVERSEWTKTKEPLQEPKMTTLAAVMQMHQKPN